MILRDFFDFFDFFFKIIGNNHNKILILRIFTFLKGDNLLKMKAVKNPLQIGFHLMGTVTPGGGKPSQSTSVTFDRKKITKCSCSCNPQAEWCAHVVALCLHRIHQVCMSKNQVHEIFSQSFVVVNFQDLFTTYFFYLSFFTAKFCRKKSSNE